MKVLMGFWLTLLRGFLLILPLTGVTVWAFLLYLAIYDGGRGAVVLAPLLFLSFVWYIGWQNRR